MIDGENARYAHYPALGAWWVLLIPERSFGSLTGVHIVVGSKLRYPIGSQTLIRRPVDHTHQFSTPTVLQENPGREEDQLLIRGVLNVRVTCQKNMSKPIGSWSDRKASRASDVEIEYEIY
jgi:hypothetical protein